MADIRRGAGEHPFGYTAHSEISGNHADMLMDFGVLRLQKGDVFQDDHALERAYLLVYGEIEMTVDGETQALSRDNCFDTGPVAVHVDKRARVTLRGLASDSEVCVTRTGNDTPFATHWYMPEGTKDEYRGAGLMQEASTRIVRTIFDHGTAPYAKLVLGEVIGFPGKWSSYPPHHHPQPEIYYYKTNPSNGFAYAELGEDVYKIHTNDTVFIAPGLTHPHVTPPGYALWYLWVIRHLDENPYITPTFLDEHLWVQEKDAIYWPERKGIK